MSMRSSILDTEQYEQPDDAQDTARWARRQLGWERQLFALRRVAADAQAARDARDAPGAQAPACVDPRPARDGRALDRPPLLVRTARWCLNRARLAGH